MPGHYPTVAHLTAVAVSKEHAVRLWNGRKSAVNMAH